MERRLAAVLAADMVGYSRLIEDDEEGTIARQKAHRKELIDPQISKHGGRVFKTTGDGFLVEFSSAIGAVSCAVAVQEAMGEREGEVPKARRICYRIGVNLGDIVIDGDDILGDGVNVAARLEGLAEPGGVCISRKVMHEVQNKLNIGFEFIGERSVKNITSPVPTYRVLFEPDSAGIVTGEQLRAKLQWKHSVLATAVLVVIATGIVWWQPWDRRMEPTSMEAMVLPLPAKPSIAVMPFDNLSEDSNQEYFADGMSEDLITDLSKLSGLFVIARNSSFAYKGQRATAHEVAEGLGVRYVLEGSVRKVDNQVRINIQLIDATTGGHLWAERYDGRMDDVFEMQDRITRQIVNALSLKLTAGDKKSLRRHGTTNIEAYDAYLEGLKHMAERRLFDADPLLKARSAFEKAVKLDPEFSEAIAGLAWATWQWAAIVDFLNADLRAEAIELANRAQERHETALAYRVLSRQFAAPDAWGYEFTLLRDFQGAIKTLEKALAIEPNNASVMVDLAYMHAHSGEAKRAVALINQAKRLNPNYPDWYYAPSGIANYLTGNYSTAIRDFEGWVEAEPIPKISKFWLAAATAQQGDIDRAKALFMDALRIHDSGLTEIVARNYYWSNFVNKEDLDLIIDGLRKAGLPNAPD